MLLSIVGLLLRAVSPCWKTVSHLWWVVFRLSYANFLYIRFFHILHIVLQRSQYFKYPFNLKMGLISISFQLSLTGTCYMICSEIELKINSVATFRQTLVNYWSKSTGTLGLAYQPGV